MNNQLFLLLATALISASVTAQPIPIPRQSADCGLRLDRFSSPLEAAADPQMLGLFQAWLGIGTPYLSRSGKWREDLTGIRANSLQGLKHKKFTSCRIGVNGYSGFARYGQARGLGAKGNRGVLGRNGGNVLPGYDSFSTETQATVECYCKVFNALAPYWVQLRYLEP